MEPKRWLKKLRQPLHVQKFHIFWKSCLEHERKSFPRLQLFGVPKKGQQQKITQNAVATQNAGNDLFNLCDNGMMSIYLFFVFFSPFPGTWIISRYVEYLPHVSWITLLAFRNMEKVCSQTIDSTNAIIVKYLHTNLRKCGYTYQIVLDIFHAACMQRRLSFNKESLKNPGACLEKFCRVKAVFLSNPKIYPLQLCLDHFGFIICILNYLSNVITVVRST